MKAVGLAIVVLWLSCFPAGGQEDTLAAWRRADAETRRAALTLARHAFDAYILRREAIDPPLHMPSLLGQRAAVFVSAMRAGAPRCCMGSLYPIEPTAAQEIIAGAVAAAGRDRRFPPIRPAERTGLTLIVSIVSPPRPMTLDALPTLDPEREGLVAKRGDRYGVVLSGETHLRDRMLAWARIRAGAGPNDPVSLFRIESVRFVEEREH